MNKTAFIFKEFKAKKWTEGITLQVSKAGEITSDQENQKRLNVRSSTELSLKAG